MRKKKALLLSLWLCTLLLWLFIAIIIVIDTAPFSRSRLFTFIPWYTFTGIGSIFFVLSMIFMFLFLVEN